MNSLSSVFKHTLFRNGFLYTASNVIRNAIPFFLLPVLTRYLTPADYGVVATFQVLLAVAMVFVGLRLSGAVSVNFFKLSREELKVYIANVIFIETVAFFLIVGIIYFCAGYLSVFLKFPRNWLLIVVVIAFSRSILTINLSLWQAEQKVLSYGMFQILQTVVDVGLSLFFVAVLGWKWQGRLSGVLASSAVFAFLGVVIICKRKYIRLSFNKAHISNALFFGIGLIPAALGGWIITGIDRIFINSMVGVSATGIYVVGYQVGLIISILAIAFNQTWAPFLFEKLKEDNYSTKLKIVKFTYLYFITITAFALIVSFFAPVFLRVFVGKSFQPAYKYVLWIALGYAANGMYFMVVNYIFYVEKTYLLSLPIFSSAIANVILNYFLIKANGPIGAAQATTISFFLSFVLTWFLSARVYKMPWLIVKPGKTA